MIKLLVKATAGLTLVFTLFCCFNIQTAKAQPGETVTIQTFYDELEPYGQWVNDPELGYVWAPDVDQSFKPYATNGHWAETEYGNTWVSDYEWGWAAFHYGRWRYDEYYGWEWIPGTEWAPAWVNWRTGGDYYGWAPLGPGIDIDIAFGRGFYAPDNYWVFVPRQYLCSPSINRYYLPASRNITIIRNTTIINNVYNGGSRRYISGPPRAEIQRYTGSRISIYNINNNNRPGPTRISNNSINIYRPQIAANNDGNNQPAPNRVINRGSNEDNRNRNNNFGRNNGNPNSNNGFGNSRQPAQGNSNVQGNNPVNNNPAGNTNTGYTRPARTDNNSRINGNQFPQRNGNSGPTNNAGSNNTSVVPVTPNGNADKSNNPGNRTGRENQAAQNNNVQPGTINGQQGNNDWRQSRNFDRNRNRPTDNQQIQQQNQQMQQRSQEQQQQRQQQIQQRNQQPQQERQQRPARQDVPERRPERI